MKVLLIVLSAVSCGCRGDPLGSSTAASDFPSSVSQSVSSISPKHTGTPAVTSLGMVPSTLMSAPSTTMKAEEPAEAEVTEVPHTFSQSPKMSTTEEMEMTTASSKASSLMEALGKETTQLHVAHEANAKTTGAHTAKEEHATTTGVPMPTPAAVAAQMNHGSTENMNKEATEPPKKPDTSPPVPAGVNSPTTVPMAQNTPPPAPENPHTEATTMAPAPITTPTTMAPTATMRPPTTMPPPPKAPSKATGSPSKQQATTKKPGNSAAFLQVNLLLVCASLLVQLK